MASIDPALQLAVFVAADDDPKEALLRIREFLIQKYRNIGDADLLAVVACIDRVMARL